jgi:beta-galactosidase
MSEKISLNNNWHYVPHYEAGMECEVFSKFQLVHLPHTNIELPYNYFDERDSQFISCYQNTFFVDESYKEKIGFIRFEGVMTYAKVFLNGAYIGDHKGGYTPFECELNENIHYGNSNTITVVVDSTEREDIPPFGGQIDYLTYGGIYREVSLLFYDPLYIKNAQIKCEDTLEVKKKLVIDIYTVNTLQVSQEATLNMTVQDASGSIVYEIKKQIHCPIGYYKHSMTYEAIENIALWDLDHPNLYTISLEIQAQGYKDIFEAKYGFRTCDFKADGFYLNNEKVKIIGLNRHQSFPYNGYAMPKRVQEKDADILKYELHLNLVRTSHYPQSIHFLNRCDEIGLLVFEEIPGWQHIGNEAWKKVAIHHVGEMIERDWNHPSIVLWGVRVNESPDDDAFYQETNAVARALDSSRQTGGVRYIDNSRLLEDVYTMNDFSHSGKETILRPQREVTHLDYDVPYMVTEYNGHMYPTKKFDQEERQMEHVLRHLKIQDASFLADNVSGAIGWCAFDYNTHKDFGAGDRICYHGVMDMFRIKKFAAGVYASQVSPKVETILEPVTFWARGERSIGGILPLIILTNCEYVELAYGEFESKRFYPSNDLFKGLPYPPVVIDETMIKASEVGEWGMKWRVGVFSGFVNGEKVIERRFSENPVPSDLSVVADDYQLSAKEKDATRIVLESKDQCGNPMVFLEEVISITVSGAGKLIGPKQFTLKGGSTAFWVETVNQLGQIEIEIQSTRFKTKKLSIVVS